jgi:Flp pilus assembly protein TadD
VTTFSVSNLMEAGEALLDARKYDQALALASQAVANQPQDPKAHALAARALSGLERVDEAAGAAAHAVSLSPNLAYYHRLLAITLQAPAGMRDRRMYQGRVLHANAAALEAVRLAPYDPANYRVLAETFARLGHKKQADDAIRKAIELNPNCASNWATASFVATRGRNWYAAEIAARKALSIDPQNYAAANNLGVALRFRGRWMQGAVAFHGAAQIDPRSSTARENVESVGFQYMQQVAVLVLLPLVIVWPLWVIAGISLKRWVARRPERYRPLARRLGLWIATSKRHQRRFTKEAARAEKMAASIPANGWSSLHNYRPTFASLPGRAICVVCFTVIFAIAAINSGTSAQALAYGVLAAAVLVAGAVWLGVPWLRLRLQRRRSA